MVLKNRNSLKEKRYHGKNLKLYILLITKMSTNKQIGKEIKKGPSKALIKKLRNKNIPGQIETQRIMSSTIDIKDQTQKRNIMKKQETSLAKTPENTLTFKEMHKVHRMANREDLIKNRSSSWKMMALLLLESQS